MKRFGVVDLILMLILLALAITAIVIAFISLEHEVTWWYIPIVALVLAVVYNLTLKKFLLRRYWQRQQDNPKAFAFIYAFNAYIGVATLIIIFLLMISHAGSYHPVSP